MSRRRPVTFSVWQKQLIAELKSLAGKHTDDVMVIQKPQLEPDGNATLRIRIHTAEIQQVAGGLELGEDEDFILRIPPVAFLPPIVEVDHNRFLGFPHVLQGRRLCIYLDPSREWSPNVGMAGFLSRLWVWLTDAAGGVFNPSTAMYHAVGGVLHQTVGTPTVVVREPGPVKRIQIAWLIRRSSDRYDLTYKSDRDGHRTHVFTLASDLPFGATSTFAHLLRLLDDPYLDRAQERSVKVPPQSPAFITSLLASALRNSENMAQYFVLAVPHPMGGPHHLLCGRLPVSASNTLRRIAKKHGTVVDLNPETIATDIPIEWCNISDERHDVTTRRDEDRPVNGFRGKSVHIWGCGGLGSWFAEFIARAGVRAITLCDQGTVTGGLLVRQNYAETDIGQMKARALASRLREIRDDLTVTVSDGNIPEDIDSALNADLIIDATVSLSITTYLDTLAGKQRNALIVQVATDARTGSLGIANIWAPGFEASLSKIDQQSGRSVLANGELELYHQLWQETLDGDELTPTRGCSVPTFHGSAADLAAVAATLVNLIGLHLQADELVSGTHLIALPHASDGPRHRFIVVPADTSV